jgi:hypothetical protein
MAEGESPLSTYWSVRSIGIMLTGVLALGLVAALFSMGAMPSSTENLVLYGALIVLMLLPVLRKVL